jgi:AcrR family transcriptional regulator
VTRILDALMVTVDRYGSRKVSVTDVCHEAGISRGTVYRYFPTREHLLEALGARSVAMLRQAVQDAVEADPAVERRIAVVVTALTVLAGDGAHFRALYRSEPTLILHHFQAHWQEIIGVVHAALAPAFSGDGAAHRLDVAADVLARHLLSKQLVRSDHTTASDLVELLASYAAGGDRRIGPRAP